MDVINGNLNYRSTLSFITEGDLRITYYKLKTDNKISIIGEKRGNDIIPKRDLNGYEDTEIFKTFGDELELDDFIKMLKEEKFGVFIAFIVMSVIIIVVGLILLICGFFKNK